MKVNFSRINNGLEINKKQIQASIAPKTRKEDKDYKYKLYPLVSVSIAQNLILQNNKLDKAIRILAQDVILNEFTYLNDEKETDENLINFWKNNINELYKQVQEFYSYGFGASEIIFDEKTGRPKELYQIPAETVTIKQETNGKGKCFYVSVAYVSIYGLNFVNGKYDGNGCAVYGNTTGLYVIDCTFTNNIGNNSSALFFYGNNSYAINCIFKNNVTAINSTGRDDIIHDCVFINNSYAINRSVNGLSYSFKGNKFLSPASNVKDRLINCTSLDYSTTNHTHSGYAASTHNHAISDITDLETNLNNKLSDGDAVTSIALVPKSENSTGAIRLYYGDES